MPENLLPNKENDKKEAKTTEKKTPEHQIDEKLTSFDEQSTVSLQTIEREVKEEKQKKEEPKNEVSFTVSLGMGVWAKGESWTANPQEVFSTHRAEVAGSFFKGGVLQTDMYGFLDMDWNPLKSTGYGQLHLSKQVYKGMNVEGVYEFIWSGGSTMKYGVSYAGQLENGGYKLKLLPLSHQGKILDIDVSGYTKVGKNGQINSFLNVYGLDKAFYGETEYVHDLWKNIAGFVQARYGGPLKEPFVAGTAGIRLTLK